VTVLGLAMVAAILTASMLVRLWVFAKAIIW